MTRDQPSRTPLVLSPELLDRARILIRRFLRNQDPAPVDQLAKVILGAKEGDTPALSDVQATAALEAFIKTGELVPSGDDAFTLNCEGEVWPCISAHLHANGTITRGEVERLVARTRAVFEDFYEVTNNQALAAVNWLVSIGALESVDGDTFALPHRLADLSCPGEPGVPQTYLTMMHGASSIRPALNEVAWHAIHKCLSDWARDHFGAEFLKELPGLVDYQHACYLAIARGTLPLSKEDVTPVLEYLVASGCLIPITTAIHQSYPAISRARPYPAYMLVVHRDLLVDPAMLDTRILDGDVEILARHVSSVDSLAYSPDGSLLASASNDCTIRLWNTRIGKELCIIIGHEDIVTCVAFSPDGRSLVSSSNDGTVRCWDVATCTETWRFAGYPLVEPQMEGETHIPSYVNVVAFSPDGTRVAAGAADSTLRILEARIGHQILLCKKTYLRDDNYENADPIQALTFSPFKHTIITVSRDGFLRHWNLTDGMLIRESKPSTILGKETGGLYAVFSSPDGNELYTALGPDLVALNSSNDKIAGVIATKYAYPIALSHNGTMIATGCNLFDIQVLKSSNGKRYVIFAINENGEISVSRDSLLDIKHDKRIRVSFSLQALVFSSNCQYLTSGWSDGRIINWQLLDYTIHK